MNCNFELPQQISAPQLVEQLVAAAHSRRASDIHLQMIEQNAHISLRIDGVLTPLSQLPAPVSRQVFGRIKFLARLKTYQHTLPQEGRIDKHNLSSPCDIRVSTYPTVTGEKIVLRLFARTTIKTLAQLEFPQAALCSLQAFLRKTSGLLLLTGPAGSGKTTTIYACLQHLAASGGLHIITIEDPVEQIIPNIMQTEIRNECGLDFATAARHLLRQDPQVIVIGEIRDEETAVIAVRAAFTGHLVIATLHAGSCKGVLERLLVMCPDHYAVISAVEMIINQRLLRKLCQQCCGSKCQDCFASGYYGRVPVVEWLHLNDALKKQIHKDGLETVQPAVSLRQAARELLQNNVSDQAEYLRIFGDELR